MNNDEERGSFLSLATSYLRHRSGSAALSLFSTKTASDGFASRSDERNWSWNYLRKRFRVKLNLEQLYLRYQSRISISYFAILLLTQIVISLLYSSLLVIYNYNTLQCIAPEMTVQCVYISTSATIMILTHQERLFREFQYLEYVCSIVYWAVYMTGEISLEFYFIYYKDQLPAVCKADDDDIGVSLFPLPNSAYIILIVYLFLPIRKTRFTLLLSLFTSATQLTINSCVLYRGGEEKYLRNMVVTDIIYHICIHAIGLSARFLIEIRSRRAFLDRRACIESTIKLQYEQNQEHKLLRSVLPEHIAEQVHSDIRCSLDHNIDNFQQRIPKQPFSQIYVERHNNVSILFADIVYFTRLTIDVSVADLVNLLNELFQKFDDAAKKNDCLRIKILGDCYYCVSGMPIKTERHAHHCVEMGFEMIDIVHDIRDRHRLSLDMRIGIHSGSVISGVLGICKYQFDVWSNDVIIANHLESSGYPSQIQISSQTMELLGDDYHYKCAYGERRDCFLAKNNIESFFICNQTADEMDENENITRAIFGEICYLRPRSYSVPASPDSRSPSVTSFEIQTEFVRTSSKRRATFDIDVIDNSQENKRTTILMDDSLTQYRKLIATADVQMKEAIDNMPIRIFCQKLSSSNNGISPVLLSFDNFEYEGPYICQPDPLFKYYLVCMLVTSVGMYAIQRFMLPEPMFMTKIGYITTMLIILFLIPLSWAEYVWIKFKDPHRELDEVPRSSNIFLRILILSSNYISTKLFIRYVLYFVIISLIISCGINHGLDCWYAEQASKLQIHNVTVIFHFNSMLVGHAFSCIYPWYLTYICTLTMISNFMFIRVHFLLKLFVTCLAICGYTFMIFVVRPSIVDEHFETWFPSPSLPNSAAHVWYIVANALLLHVLDRQVAYMSRLDYIWKRKVLDDQNEVKSTRIVNKSLLHNILPAHVAEIYLNKNRPSNSLYHESYKYVCVMFASIPAYLDFYNESEFNDNGLRCLKLLNEIICDFDKLLFLPEFATIEKIKLIGSTYMAACGLKPGRRKECDKCVVDPSMLVTMIKFASAMMKVLDTINREALQDFQLRIGIEYGPVIAGVVGAQKPFYDIWGNTVNMASRMDSTGEVGKIQITEETAKILRNEGINCEFRGLTFVKGPGLMPTYFIKLDQNHKINSESSV